MRKRISLSGLFLCGCISLLSAQTVITDTLVFVFSLHGQTRKYQINFETKQDTLYLRWGIERNTKWQSGSYAMSPESSRNAVRLSFQQPEDGCHVLVSPEETVAILSQSAYRALKEKGVFCYNQTEYRQKDSLRKAFAYSLVHVVDSIDGSEMWILDNPDFPVIWEMANNPLGINWEIQNQYRTHSDGQILREELYSQPEKMGSIYYAYPQPTGKPTPAPTGYVPFYVSHYGRHGSRWLTSDDRYRDVLDIFENQELTSLGKDVLNRLKQVWEDARGRSGDLTPLGEHQHKMIAERLYRNYPQVFQGEAPLSARSSTVGRCIMSMSAFCERLKELNPSLRLTCEANQRYMDYIAFTSPEGRAFSADTAFWRKDFQSFERSHISPHRLIASLFVHPEEIANPSELMMGLYWIASDMQNVELPLSFFDIFEKEELFDIWQTVNYRMYVCNASAPVNQGIMPYSAASLLKNIIESADHAISLGTPCATFRFGHDTNLIRLLALVQLEGCSNQETTPGLYHLAWQDFRVSPMAANLQIIFFKNHAGDVIIKFLHNECEVRMPIDSAIAPYYSWEVVRAFFISLITF